MEEILDWIALLKEIDLKEDKEDEEDLEEDSEHLLEILETQLSY
jgi:hypothetical protein